MIPFLQLSNIDVGYTTPLIKNISTSANLGDVILLMGNNGVGKTTLIKTLLNQIKILSGTITINSQDIRHLSQQSIAEQIAIVFSKAEIPSNYTVEELITFGKFIHYPFYFRIDDNDKIEIDVIIESLNLDCYRKTQLQHLSDGNLQKAFIGRALAQNSPMIILDEPTTHLDDENKLMILNLLRNLATSHNKLILFSSHDWRLSSQFADSIWWVKAEQLFANIAEELLFNNLDILNTYNINNNLSFIPPNIEADSVAQDLLISFLKKHFNNDLSHFTIIRHNSYWTIQYQDKIYDCHTFSQIKDSLQSSLNSTI